MTIYNPRKIGRIARERFSSALMSDAKWRKLLSAVEAADLGVKQMVAKFIDGEEPQVMAFPPSFDCPHAYIDTIEFGSVELRAIEWLELPADVGSVARGLGKFPLEQVESGIRVVGYRA